MKEPTRWKVEELNCCFDADMVASPTGEFVLWEDYDATCETLAHTETERDASEAENARLKAEVERLNELVNNPYRLSQGWRPIETAPKDGTTFLAYDFFAMQRVCHWGFTDGMDETLLEGFIYIGDIGELSHPTHWMPLPKPPTK